MPTEEDPGAPSEPDADAGGDMPSTSGGEGENQVEGEAPTAEHPAAAEHRHKRRRVLVASLLALATVIGVFAVFAVWANRQVLNSENWTNTSSQLLAAPKVQAVLGDFLANEAFEAVPVEQELEHALPAKVRGLAGPATAGLRSLASQYMPQFLATSAVQEAWREATTVVHDELIKLLEGGGPALSTTKGEVVLHLKPLVEQLAGQLGLSHQLHELQSKLNSSTGEVAKSKAEEKLKEHGITVPKNGEIVLMRSNQLAAAQDLFEGIKGLSVVLPILAILLFAAAVALAVGWRRVALRSAGWCVFALGLIAILVRKVGGEQVVNDLVREPNRPAMTEVWQISTTELYDIAIALITYGLVIVIAAWLAGPTRPATALRRAMTPTLRDHPGRAYGIGGVILLLAVIWGPFPSLREFWPIVGIAVLIALGIYTLRRASEREFPDAHAGETIAALRERYSRARHGSR